MKKTLLFFLSFIFACSIQATNKSITSNEKLIILAPSVPDFTASAEGICVGQSVTFTDLSTGNPIKWAWVFAGATPSTSTIQNPVVTYNTPGVFSVTLTVTTSDGDLTVIKTDLIKVFSIPVATFSFSGNQCQIGNSFNFTNTGSSGTHAWSFAGGSPATSSAANPTGISFGNITGSRIITHTVTDNGCVGSTSGTITVFPAIASLSVTPTSANCTTGLGSFTIGATSGGGIAPFTYSVNGVATGSTIVYPNKISGSYTVNVKDIHGCTSLKIFTVAAQNPPTNVAITVTNTACNSSGGKIKLSPPVTGGTPGYSVSFNGGSFIVFTAALTFTNLTAGSYNVKILDANGCTSPNIIAQVQNTSGPTNAILTTTNAICGASNGRVKIGTITGGTGPFFSNFNNEGFLLNVTNYPNRAAGTYPIDIKDQAGCIFPSTVTIANIQPTAAVISITNTPCNFSTGVVNIGVVTGGTPTLSYSFNGGTFSTTTTFTGLGVNNYPIVIKDGNNCTFTTSANVINTNGPNNLDITITNELCENGHNGSISIGAVGGGTGGPYQYEVNQGGFTDRINYPGLIAGTYHVAVKEVNTGCEFIKDVILQNIKPTGISISITSPPCNVNTGIVTLGPVIGGQPSYSLSFNNAPLSLYTNNSAVFNALQAGSYPILIKDSNNCTFTTSANVNNSSGVTDAIITSTNATCSGTNGIINIGTVTGGTLPIKFALDGQGFSDLRNYTGVSANSHQVSIIDGIGCLFNRTIVIQNITPIAVNISIVSPSCNINNGSVTLSNVTGGQPSYSLSFNGSSLNSFTAAITFTGIAAGAFPVKIVDANNCTFTTTANVNNSSGPNNAVITTTDATCFVSTGVGNGVINIGAVTGGTGHLQFAIDNIGFTDAKNYSGQRDGNHTITIRDSIGCLFNSTINLLNIEPIGINSTIINPACNTSTGSVTLGNVIGGKPIYSLSFDNGPITTVIPTTINGLAARNYSLTITDGNGCIFKTTINVINSSGPTAVAITSVNAVCSTSNGVITIGAVTGTSTPFNYSVDGSAFSPTLVTYPNQAAGNHIVTVKDAAGCVLNKIVPIQNIAPSDIAFTVTNTPCGVALGKIKVTEVFGGVPGYSLAFGNGVFTTFTSAVTFTGLAADSYVIKIKDANNCIVSFSPVVNNISGPQSMNIQVSNNVCDFNDGGIIQIISVTGGTPTFSYSLDNFATTSTVGVFGLLPSGDYLVAVKDAAGCELRVPKKILNGNGVPNFLFTTASSTCNLSNGSITFSTVTGGTPNYQYFVDNVTFGSVTTFTGLAAGTHTLKVRDAIGCSVSKTVTVLSVSGPTAINFASKNAGCYSSNDGRITIFNVFGGVQPYSFSIGGGLFTPPDNGISTKLYNNLVSGTYPITIKDGNNCTFTTAITIVTVAPGTGCAVAKTNPGCGTSNGIINLFFVTGGTAPYSFFLGGGTTGSLFSATGSFTGLGAADYNITIKDANQCQIINVGGQQKLFSTGGPSDINLSIAQPSCGLANGVITANSVVGGAQTYSYSLNGGPFTTLATYTGQLATQGGGPLQSNLSITVKDGNGCMFTENPVLTSGFSISTPTISKVSNSSTLTSNYTSGNQWRLNGTDIPGATGQIFVAQFNGTYTAKVTLGSCSPLTSNSIVITNLTGGRMANMNQEDESQNKLIDPFSLSIFPNPNNGNFNVSFNTNIKTSYNLEVHNVIGQIVFKDELIDFEGTYNKELQLSEFGKGVYYISLMSSKNNTVKKIITH